MRLPTLTGRELDVLVLASEGSTNAKIGEELGIAVRTVDSHLARIYSKLCEANPDARHVPRRRAIMLFGRELQAMPWPGAA